jgi:hypothetical protein
MLYKWEHAETPENRREYAGIMRDAWKEVEYD